MDINTGKKRTKDEAASSCLSLWTSPGKLKRQNRRREPLQRSVHFADDHFTATSSSCTQPLHTIHHVENWMNSVDKEVLWVHSSVTLQNVMAIRARGRLYQLQIPTSTSQLAYSEALQSSYLQCCYDAQDGDELNSCLDDADLPVKSNTRQVALNITDNNELFNSQLLGLYRGSEAYYVPDLAITRLLTRKNLIQTIVIIDQTLRCHPHRDILLGNLVRPLTIPSRRFAHMLGMVDEINAFGTPFIPRKLSQNEIATAMSATA